MNTLEKIAVTLGLTLSTIVLGAALYMMAGRMLSSEQPKVQVENEKHDGAKPTEPAVDVKVPVAPKNAAPVQKSTPKSQPKQQPKPGQNDKLTNPPPPPVPMPSITPKGKCSIKGKLLKDSAPAAGIPVDLYMMERTPDGVKPKVISSVSSGGSGEFEFAELAPHIGYWIIARKKDSGMACRQMIELRTDGTVKDLGEIKMENASIRGVVTDDKQRPMAGVSITIEKSLNVSESNARHFLIEKAVSDEAGGYTASPMDEGIYQVRAEKTGYTTVSLPLKIPSSSQPYVRNFILRPSKKQ